MQTVNTTVSTAISISRESYTICVRKNNIGHKRGAIILHCVCRWGRACRPQPFPAALPAAILSRYPCGAPLIPPATPVQHQPTPHCVVFRRAPGRYGSTGRTVGALGSAREEPAPKGRWNFLSAHALRSGRLWCYRERSPLSIASKCLVVVGVGAARLWRRRCRRR
jgi:hypothetical protein